jgi:hypothetical protein
MGREISWPNTGCTVSRLTGLCLALSIVLLQGFLPQVKAEEAILPYFREETSSSGRSVLFIRRTPVIITVAGFEQEMHEAINDFMVPYIQASSLPISVSKKDINFIILRGKGLVQDGNLKPDAMIRSGLPSVLVSKMTQASGWSSGCVPYVFPDDEGNIGMFVGIVDEILDRSAQKRCIAEIVTRAFGFGVGEKSELPQSINPLKFAYALDIVTKCDKEHAAKSLDDVKSCIAQRAKALKIKGRRSLSSHFDTLAAERDPGRDNQVLFIRKKPVVLFASGFDQAALEEMSRAAAIYAKASSLPLSFSNKDANLVIYKMQNVNRGTSVNTDTLRRLNIPAGAISAMSEGKFWSSGCGLYNFGNKQGRLAGTIALVDESLDPDKQAGCVSAILLLAFGFGSKLDDGLKLARPMNVSKLAYILNIAASCDVQHAADSVEAVKDCSDGKAGALDLRASLDKATPARP